MMTLNCCAYKSGPFQLFSGRRAPAAFALQQACAPLGRWVGPEGGLGCCSSSLFLTHGHEHNAAPRHLTTSPSHPAPRTAPLSPPLSGAVGRVNVIHPRWSHSVPPHEPGAAPAASVASISLETMTPPPAGGRQAGKVNKLVSGAFQLV